MPSLLKWVHWKVQPSLHQQDAGQSGIATRQLQMGMTELKPGSVEHHAGTRAQPPYGSLLLFRSARWTRCLPFYGRSGWNPSYMDERRSGSLVSLNGLSIVRRQTHNIPLSGVWVERIWITVIRTSHWLQTWNKSYNFINLIIKIIMNQYLNFLWKVK